MEYDRLGNLTKGVNVGPDGRPVAGRYGNAEVKMRYDQHGNITEVASLGADGQLVTSPKIGSAGRTFAYDGQGNLVETTFFGPDRQLVRLHKGRSGFRQGRRSFGMKTVARSRLISVLTANSCRWGATLSNAKEFGTSVATLWKWPAWMRTTAPFVTTVGALRPRWVVTITGM